MDLRGFLPDNQGCVFEINELLNVVPLGRVVFVIDATTDLAFLRETFATGWAALAADSPNRELAEPRVVLFEFAGESSVPGLMRVVTGAARGEAGPAAPSHSASEPLLGDRCVSSAGERRRSLCLTARQPNRVPMSGVATWTRVSARRHHTQGGFYAAGF